MSLKDKLEKIRLEKQTMQVDWTKRRDEWINEVKKLYEEVAGWFTDLLDSGFMHIGIRSKTVIEDYIGKYDIDVMEMDLSVYPSVVMEPVARNVLGYSGRIDLYLKGHDTNRMMLFLVEEEGAPSRWELVTNTYKKEHVPFDKEALEKVLEYWLDAWS